MSDFTLLSNRARFLVEHYSKTQAALAKVAGVKPASVNSWISGDTKSLKGEVAKRISKAYGVSYAWLIDGTGIPEGLPVEAIDNDSPPCSSEFIPIPEYRSVFFGCGPGTMPSPDDMENTSIRWYKSDYFLKHRYDPEQCISVVVDGNSMEPCLYDGDAVLINRADHIRIDSGHVYAFRIGDELKIKRLYMNFRGDLTIKSDNKEYADETIMHDDETVSFEIIGRVVDKSGNGGL